MDDLQTLREAVNPVFNTARACLEFDARNGDADSVRLQDALGFASQLDGSRQKTLPPEMEAVAKRLVPVFSAYVESRFHGMNRLIASLPERAVVDLPCGYTSRGVKLSRLGRRYYGFDLPAVIDAIAPAAADLHGGDRRIRYAAVDATNYETLAAPLAGEDAPLLVTTEGLLMYFTQSELKTVFANVRRLLQQHGGSWIIVDRTYYENEQRIAEAMLSGDPEALAMFKAVSARGSGELADIKTYDNDIFRGSEQEARSFIREMGFDLRELCMADFLPERLVSLEALPQSEAGVRAVFREMAYWELTARADAGGQDAASLPFAVETSFENGRFTAKIRGRMDTITAPELLEKFRSIPGEATDIAVDVGDMSYVSSAGLRVLLMMYKSLQDGSRFRLLRVSDAVREILEVTGFDQLLLP